MACRPPSRTRGPFAIAGHEVGFVKLTSGSTGAPRGVAATEAALLADDDALARTMGLRAEDRILGAIPMSHSYGFSSVALPALRRGSTIVVPDEEGPLAPLPRPRAAAATVFPSAPAYLQALLKLSQPPSWPASVRLVLSASAPLPPDVAAQFQRPLRPPRARLLRRQRVRRDLLRPRGTAAARARHGRRARRRRDACGWSRSTATAPKGLVTVESAVGGPRLPSRRRDPRLGGGRFVTSDLAVFEGGRAAPARPRRRPHQRQGQEGQPHRDRVRPAAPAPA